VGVTLLYRNQLPWISLFVLVTVNVTEIQCRVSRLK